MPDFRDFEYDILPLQRKWPWIIKSLLGEGQPFSEDQKQMLREMDERNMARIEDEKEEAWLKSCKEVRERNGPNCIYPSCSCASGEEQCVSYK